MGLIIGACYNIPYLLVNLSGRLFTVIPVLGDLPAKEYLLLLLAECKGTEFIAHPVITDHFSSKFGCPFDIVAGPCCLHIEDDLFRGPSTH